MPTATSDRLAALRALMADRNLHAYIVPSEDAHQSEYIAACDGRRAFISGFTGSAGIAIVTETSAALWTDGRYFLQASQQLDSNWILQKSGLPDVPSKEEWLVQVLPPASRVGLDPTVITVSAARTLSESLTKAGHALVPTPGNLVDKIWADRPAAPAGKAFLLPVRYAGKHAEEKIADLRKAIDEKKGVWGVLVSALDEIAWLFNLRGADIPYNPVFFAYALVAKSEVFLYVDEAKLDDSIKQELSRINVTIRPYASVFSHLKELGEKYANEKLWIDSRCSLALQDSLGGEKLVEETTRSPIQSTKCIKNPVELEGFRNCHIRDASALCRFFAWLEHELVEKRFRSALPDFIGLSFDTISGSGSNGSIIHYKPEKETCKKIDVNALYLCDSGAQFWDGTTDVTRTLHFGTPKPFEKEAFTRVLKGHIQIDLTVFPRGTTGYILDPISRTALWKAGLDFRHGTGHGVGHFLNVHEGPHGIGTRIAYNDVPLEAGMTVSNEPGYYEDGEFGIRIENVLAVKEIQASKNFGGRGYLGFEHFTVVPIQTKLIDAKLLTPEELKWINDYNQECFEKVSPLLEPGSLAYKWLEKESQPLLVA
ncbi:peptidase M24, structural domain-containing protein [Zopfochytrium polystomum]|nr:peptidase M24, structural domain-containing protein [Zopfochytrium polystomum]